MLQLIVATTGATCELPGLEAVDWNPASVASGYGQFSGLLAGFCIVGLFWLVSREADEVDPTAVVGLWASVVPLALAALLYHEASGVLTCDGASYDVLAPSYLLSIGASTLFFYLGELIGTRLEKSTNDAGVGIDHAVALSRLVYWAVIIIASASMISLNLISIRLVEGNLVVGAVQAIAIGAGLLHASLSRSGRRWHSWMPERIRSWRHKRPLGVLLLCMIGFAASLATTFGGDPDTRWFYAGTTVRTVLWIAFLALLVGWRRPLPKPHPAPT